MVRAARERQRRRRRRTCKLQHPRRHERRARGWLGRSQRPNVGKGHVVRCSSSCSAAVLLQWVAALAAARGVDEWRKHREEFAFLVR